MSAESDSDFNHLNLNHFNHLERERPSIDHTLTATNVTGQLGATVYLHCIVHNLGQKTCMDETEKWKNQYKQQERMENS
ncbi:hypothetical protein BIW11_11805 [Tropilaelaps mercedesae]|uniref:Uncharacterized protein n=1 Tax=Tropilaelaps mercedesae TaxID=418985 RepID=A0A1V9X9E3_9ACAR|nr:hypothetical protein BIW11_11805 [Tropilaelaps mercedesae]